MRRLFYFAWLTHIIFYAILGEVHIHRKEVMNMKGGASASARGSGSRFILFFAFSFVCAGVLILIIKCSQKSKYILPDGDGAFLVLLFLLISLFGVLREGSLLVRDGMKRFDVLRIGWLKSRRDSETCDKSRQT